MSIEFDDKHGEYIIDGEQISRQGILNIITIQLIMEEFWKANPDLLDSVAYPALSMPLENFKLWMNAVESNNLELAVIYNQENDTINLTVNNGNIYAKMGDSDEID